MDNTAAAVAYTTNMGAHDISCIQSRMSNVGADEETQQLYARHEWALKKTVFQDNSSCYPELNIDQLGAQFDYGVHTGTYAQVFLGYFMFQESKNLESKNKKP